jgi:DNA-directed RNA polymerase subunit RPC12/RpoP
MSRMATADNCLQTHNPSLAKEWHPTKNGNLTPRNVAVSSNKKVWWLCQKGHEWEAIVANRNRGNDCPYCAGKIVNDQNCLQTVNPTLAKEWHPTKNGSLTPMNVTAGSHSKVWWQCPRGHEWKAIIYSRNSGIGCPNCHSQTSLLELRVFTEMKFLFHDAEHRKKIHGVECDVYLPSLNLAIEVDGVYYHKDKYEPDKAKTDVLKRRNVDLIRIREKGLSKVSSYDILCKTKRIDFGLFHSLIQQIISLKSIDDLEVKKRIQDYLKKTELANNEEFLKLWNILPSPFPEVSLKMLNPTLAKEWHPTRNVSLTPIDVAVSSSHKVWWRCLKGHEWEATVNNRNKGNRCPYCVGKKVNDENCLQTVNPDLTKEWHPTKNGSLTPSDITAGYTKKVWWRCKKGHEWEALISNRSKGNRCPACSGRVASVENCLQTLNPSLSKEWHPTKNGILTPINVTVSSNQKVWWQCSKGHEWKSYISNRSRGNRCPACFGNKATDENCLQTINPALAMEWHPTKNGNLTPRDVKAGSNKKVWWLCSKDHEWQTTVIKRSKGRGCHVCTGRIVSDDNCLQTVNPNLAKEWHPTKNGNLTPKDVTAGSGRKVWWLCSNGHEWEAVVGKRNKGHGCHACYRQGWKRL